jgi:hypothetical protein
MAALAAGPAGAACRLALALGFDVSHSVSPKDYRIQRDGLVAALRDPGIRAAFLKPRDRVRIALFEWSGQDYQETVLDWVEVGSAADLETVISAILAHERDPGRRPTAMGEALEHGLDLLDAQKGCTARTLDMSGDGRSNTGVGPDRVYQDRDWGEVTVNGLAIGGLESDIFAYYRTEVIRGRGAFVQPARTEDDFPQAIRLKLEKELSEAVLGGTPGRTGAGPSG